MRIALFGGTFDPPHRGHLAVARACVERFKLDSILFAPTGRQPLKPDGATASFADRLAMCDTMCRAENAGSIRACFEASSLEKPREDGKPNFTIDTLRTLQSDLENKNGDADKPVLFVIAGADSFLDLRRWHAVDELLSTAEWIVVSRPGFSLGDLEPLGLTQQQLEHVHLLGGVHQPVSATEVRRRLDAGLDCSDLLTPEVLAYIHEHQLYGLGAMRESE